MVWVDQNWLNLAHQILIITRLSLKKKNMFPNLVHDSDFLSFFLWIFTEFENHPQSSSLHQRSWWCIKISYQSYFCLINSMHIWLKLLNFIETCEEKCDENSYCLNGRCYCLPGYKHDPVTKRCYHSKGKWGLGDYKLNWNSKVQIFMDRGNAKEKSL